MHLWHLMFGMHYFIKKTYDHQSLRLHPIAPNVLDPSPN